MKVAVISPHVGDAIFSVAEHMLSRPDWEFTIVCPFGGQPTEEPHRSKYIILHDEHRQVCELMGWGWRNGEWLDDAAREGEAEGVLAWVLATINGFDHVWWPHGIHHPDHLIFNRFYVHASFYEELPYRVLYPEGADVVERHADLALELAGYDPSYLHVKREICRMYASQVDDQLERCLYVPERLWVPR